MSANFYDQACQENAINFELFGLCDDQDGTKAYTDHSNKTKWIATIVNKDNTDLIFTAIDNCISIFRKNGEMENRCDGMVTYADNIVFVELKDERTAWITDGLKQIEITIQSFQASHKLADIKHKRAFLSNKKHKKFHVIESEIKKIFFDRYKVRINISDTIKI